MQLKGILISQKLKLTLKSKLNLKKKTNKNKAADFFVCLFSTNCDLKFPSQNLYFHYHNDVRRLRICACALLSYLF